MVVPRGTVKELQQEQEQDNEFLEGIRAGPRDVVAGGH